MPKEVADALEEAGPLEGRRRAERRRPRPQAQGAMRRARNDRRTRPLRAGAGARVSRWCRRCVPIYGARARRSGADGRRRRRPRSRSSASWRSSFGGADGLLRAVGFLRRQRVREFAFGEAADLQDHRRVGEPRRLDAAVGADPQRVRRAGRDLRRQPAGAAEGQRARRAGLDRGRVLSVHPADLEPVPAHRRRRRSRAATSIRSCRTSASRSIRRCSISAMSASRSRSRSRSRR